MANTLMQQVTDQGLLFNVSRQKLTAESGGVVKNRVAIVNENDGSVLGIVSPNYRVVTNAEVVEHMSDALDASSLDLSDMQVDVKMAYGGARSMVNVVLPKHEIDLKGIDGGDKSRLQFTVLNSYDGRWKYLTKAGAIRMACMNGQILGSFVGSYVEYHTKRLDVQKGAEHLVSMANDFVDAGEWWTRLVERQIDREQVTRTFATFLTGQAKIPTGEDRTKFLSRPTTKRLFKLWEDYSDEMGANAYALYNSLTHFVTHKKRKNTSAAPAMLFNEQERLRRTVDKLKVFENAA